MIDKITGNQVNGVVTKPHTSVLLQESIDALEVTPLKC